MQSIAFFISMPDQLSSMQQMQEAQYTNLISFSLPSSTAQKLKETFLSLDTVSPVTPENTNCAVFSLKISFQQSHKYNPKLHQIFFIEDVILSQENEWNHKHLGAWVIISSNVMTLVFIYSKMFMLTVFHLLQYIQIYDLAFYPLLFWAELFDFLEILIAHKAFFPYCNFRTSFPGTQKSNC